MKLCDHPRLRPILQFEMPTAAEAEAVVYRALAKAAFGMSDAATVMAVVSARVGRRLQDCAYAAARTAF